MRLRAWSLLASESEGTGRGLRAGHLARLEIVLSFCPPTARLLTSSPLLDPLTSRHGRERREDEDAIRGFACLLIERCLPEVSAYVIREKYLLG